MIQLEKLKASKTEKKSFMDKITKDNIGNMLKKHSLRIVHKP